MLKWGTLVANQTVKSIYSKGQTHGSKMMPCSSVHQVSLSFSEPGKLNVFYAFATLFTWPEKLIPEFLLEPCCKGVTACDKGHEQRYSLQQGPATDSYRQVYNEVAENSRAALQQL